MGSLESFLALHDKMARIDATGAGCVRGVRIIGNEGKRGAVFVVRLLMTAFLIGCVGFNAIGDGNFISLFDGRGRVACAEMAGGAFGDERIAGNKGERIDSSICSLLTTVLLIDRFIDGITFAW